MLNGIEQLDFTRAVEKSGRAGHISIFQTSLTTWKMLLISRSVRPNELLTIFRFNSSSETVTLDQLFENVPPKLLGTAGRRPKRGGLAL